MTSTNELIKASAPIFKKEKDLKELYATSDKQFFFDENRAHLHKNNKRDSQTGKDKITVVTITRAQVEGFENKTTSNSETSEFLQKSVDRIKEDLKTMTDVVVLRAFLKEEKNNQSRATAISAIEERIEAVEKITA